MEDAKTQAARRHFDRWSLTYERDPASRHLAQAQARALAQLDLKADDRLLDLGCGTGAAVRRAAPGVERAVGLDLSPAMIARARVLAQSFDNVDFREGDVGGSLPFADGEFTAILCTTAFHHFARPAEAIGEMARALTPGGRLVIGDANRDHPLVLALDLALKTFQRSHVGCPGARALASGLRDAGFESATVHTIWRGAYALVRADKPSDSSARRSHPDYPAQADAAA